jgi:DNA-binding NarL/FixJ family response regulator
MLRMVRKARLSILIADDHPLVRRGLRTLLQFHPGWTVCGEAGSGSEAIRQAMRCKPDLALLDISMPDLNGLEAATEIRRASPKTKVLILTMHCTEPFVRRAIAAGVQGYLLKSDAESDLISAVNALMKGQTFFSNAATEASAARRESVVARNDIELDCLTPREQQVLNLLAEGKSNKQLAAELGISPRTAENHRARVMDKLNLGSVSELVRYAVRHKIVDA